MKVVSPRHLAKHGLSAEQYRFKYDVPYLMSPALREQSRLKRWRDLQPHRARTSFMQIVDELRKHAKSFSTSGTCLGKKWLEKRDRSLVGQAEHVFGTWEAILKEFRASGKEPDAKRVVKAIEDTDRSLDHDKKGAG